MVKIPHTAYESRQEVNMSYSEDAVSEIEARRMLVQGCSIEIHALIDAYFEAGGVRGQWRVEVLREDGRRAPIRLAQKKEVKIYKTPTSLFSFFASSGFTVATVPLVGGKFVTISSERN